MNKLPSSFLLAFLLSAFSLLTSSCEKAPSDARPLTAQRTTNDVNAYDNLGADHNKALDYFIDKADFHYSREQVVPIVLDFGGQIGYDQSEMQAAIASPGVDAILKGAAPYQVVHDQLVAKGQTLELAYIDQMQAVFTGSPQTAAHAIEQLIVIENQVVADNELSPESQQALLRGLAVGKSSLQYWYDQAQLGAASPWAIKTGLGTTAGAKTGSQARSAWFWASIGGADALGAFLSGFGGAVACSIVAYGFWGD